MSYRAEVAPAWKPSRETPYAVTLEVPRAAPGGSWRSWTADSAGFEERLAAQVRSPVLSAEVDVQARRGSHYVRVRVAVTVEAADIAQAMAHAWDAFLTAKGDATAWDTTAASAEVRAL
jgi:hypothetical protein